MIADAEVHGDPSNACTITVIVIISIDGSIFTAVTLLSMYYGPLEGPLILSTDHTSYPVSHFSFLEVFVVLQLYYYILPVSVFSFLVIYPDAAVRHNCTTTFISSIPFSLLSSSALYYHICTVTAVAVHFFIVFRFQFLRHLHGTVVVIYTGTTVVYHMEVCVLRPLAIEISNELTRLSHSYSSKCGTCYVFVRP